jgi:hypothetical protein
MRLIIYLASNDPVASINNDTLTIARSQSGIYSRRNLQFSRLTVEDNHLRNLASNEPSILNGVIGTQRNNTQIELIAHGEGGYRLKCISPVKPYIRDITASMLKEFFDEHAFDPISAQYKFNALTIFCCESYRFGRELSQLMPDIVITCFNEDIRIDGNGQAYPYKKENDVVFAIDKNGNPVEDHLEGHFRCPLHIFHGSTQLEKTVFDCRDAVPDHIQNIPYIVLADDSVEIVGNFLEMNHRPRGIIHPPQPVAEESNRMSSDAKIESENDDKPQSESSYQRRTP